MANGFPTGVLKDQNAFMCFHYRANTCHKVRSQYVLSASQGHYSMFPAVFANPQVRDCFSLLAARATQAL